MVAILSPPQCVNDNMISVRYNQIPLYQSYSLTSPGLYIYYFHVDGLSVVRDNMPGMLHMAIVIERGTRQ